MHIIRPIRTSDLSALHKIAVETGVGFTSLPVNEALLTQKIERSVKAFSADVHQPGPESYLFVMEDTTTGEVVGTSGIEATVGLEDAFYNYHLGKVVHASRELNIYNTVEILSLSNDYTGVTEICTLYLRESARKGLNGRLLSKFRFMFMREHTQRFADIVIAEMRGVSDESGQSPFWQWLEEHFFSMDFPTADYLTGIGQKAFIAELMPKHPIYVNLLSKEAQEVIGKVHEKTKPALKLLQQEGFSCKGYVDIFDGGPTVEANLNNIVTARASENLPVSIDDAHAQQGEELLVINTEISNFRAVVCLVSSENDVAYITQEAADALMVSNGDRIRFATSKPRGM